SMKPMRSLTLISRLSNYLFSNLILRIASKSLSRCGDLRTTSASIASVPRSTTRINVKYFLLISALILVLGRNHFPATDRIGETNLISNQFGYPNEHWEDGADHNPNLMLEM